MTATERIRHLGFLAALAAVLAGGFVMATGFFPGGRFFPMFATGFGLACCALLALTLLTSRADAGGAFDASTQSAGFGTAALFFAAFGVYIGLVHGFGFFPATAVAFLVYLRRATELSAVATLAVTATTLAAIYAFGYLLNIHWPRGVIAALV